MPPKLKKLKDEETNKKALTKAVLSNIKGKGKEKVKDNDDKYKDDEDDESSASDISSVLSVKGGADVVDFDDVEEDEKEDEEEDEEVEDDEEKDDDVILDKEGDKDENLDEDDDCVYRFQKKNVLFEDEDEDEDEDDNFFDDDEDEKKNIYVSAEDRITTRKLTKYERVNIIGTRAKHISMGAQRMVKNSDHLNPKLVAKLELEKGVCPLILKRTLPSGEIELIDVNTLTIVN